MFKKKKQLVFKLKDRYRVIRNSLTGLIREVKRNFLQRQFQETKNRSNVWKAIKQLTV